jgi:hypothetical protein
MCHPAPAHLLWSRPDVITSCPNAPDAQPSLTVHPDRTPVKLPLFGIVKLPLFGLVKLPLFGLLTSVYTLLHGFLSPAPAKTSTLFDT